MNKKLLSVFLVGVMIASISFVAAKKNDDCTTIQSGDLIDSAGNPISTGYDIWGYNYQAKMFNGLYDNSARPEIPATEGDTWLMMKWNDAWLSNKDCDEDSKLDRYFGFDSYLGSGAWLTNHMYGTYEGEDEGECYWEYFTKIVAAPTDAYVEGGVWYFADGNEIGPVIWGSFATIQEISYDSCDPEFTYEYKGTRPGLGNW